MLLPWPSIMWHIRPLQTRVKEAAERHSEIALVVRGITPPPGLEVDPLAVAEIEPVEKVWLRKGCG